MRINSSQKKAKIGGGCSTKGDYTLKKKDGKQNTQWGCRDQFYKSVIIVNVSGLNISFAKIIETDFSSKFL